MSVIREILRKTFLRKIVLNYRNYKNKKTAKETLNRFYGNEIKRKDKKRLINEMVLTKKALSFTYAEFCYYNFKDLTMEERSEFVPDTKRVSFAEKLNKKENQMIFDDKSKTAEYFKKYFKRDVCKVTDESSLSDFEEFCSKHERFVVKPMDSCFGRGVEIVSLQKNAKETFYELINERKNGFLAEELIVQAEEMAKFHPQSCNTVRIPTVRFDDRVEIITPCFRIGRGDSVVDNAGSGGIIVAIDAATGITKAAADESGRSYTTHPETGCELIGFQIPRWNEAIALVNELAQIVPTNRYTGWDVALTNDGWVMVEGNARGQFIWQIAAQKGFKKEAEKVIEELNL